MKTTEKFSSVNKITLRQTAETSTLNKSPKMLHCEKPSATFNLPFSVTKILDNNTNEGDLFLFEITQLNQELENKYKSIMHVDNALDRKMVSFQANKKTPFYRWYKYKEGFSGQLVDYYINKRGSKNISTLLDPFAGSGAALFGASNFGIKSIGIELLPIGQHLIKSRELLNHFSKEDFERLNIWHNTKPWVTHKGKNNFTVLRITSGAYPPDNEIEIKRCLSRIQDEPENVKTVLMLAVFCILESVSYTRKDGQYLRWDQRSGRCLGKKPFNKGEVFNFSDALVKKLGEIIDDIQSDENKFLTRNKNGKIQIIGGSCLQELPKLKANSIDMVITSPPYCNRYDYTRTYALELAMLGVDESGIVALRQEMLSCTVENREKNLLSINPMWAMPMSACSTQALLQKILEYLYFEKMQKKLNNNGIPRMIKGYFYELACVIFELYRVLAPGGQVIMVNDNVRYCGASISVDLILSDIAQQLGFQIEEISVLPINKGNSSQQMGIRGKDPLRKCVYIWRKQ
jgi:DNA modification methylase